ncbi:MAG: APA family basic amino acid/polyamine antiporter [Candidatus Azotimanducaceae bacterium]|jgi:APA family basic amino acid/polyamine antiporter
MIGTGVFTSIGYQLADIDSAFVLLLLWVVGGCTALCGALTYAELGTRLPRSGGEYHFLGQIYHPSMGFVSGWISALVGFAAPTALVAMTFAAYLTAALGENFAVNKQFLAISLVVVLTLFHCRSTQSSAGVQNVFTVIKLLLIVLFCLIVGTNHQNPAPVDFSPKADDDLMVFSAAFAVSLIYVNYAYTGWNAVTYITSELDAPQRNLPRVLISSTLIVMVLYVLINAVFLMAAPMDLMRGKIEVGVIVAEATFGREGALVMGVVLSLLLVSTVSAMILAGPRVLQVIGEDYPLFRYFATRSDGGVPARAILLQSGLTIVFISTATFESVLIFSGFVLGLNTLFTVAGIFILRWRDRHQDKQNTSAYRTYGYPVTPLIFIGLTLWTLVFLGINRPIEVAFGVGLIAAGFAAYFLAVALGRSIVSEKPDRDRSDHI